MALSDTVVFRKTDKGQQELKTRAFGLSPRARQVLILTDGVRSANALARMIPEQELVICLTLLEGEGFVERLGEIGASIASGAGIAAGSQPAESLSAQRQRVVRMLLDAVGPHGDQVALALERCESPAELRTLIGAAASVVEAILGRDASLRFIERVGIR